MSPLAFSGLMSDPDILLLRLTDLGQIAPLAGRQAAPDQWETSHLGIASHGVGLALVDLNRDGHVDFVLGAIWLENPGRIDAD